MIAQGRAPTCLERRNGGSERDEAVFGTARSSKIGKIWYDILNRSLLYTCMPRVSFSFGRVCNGLGVAGEDTNVSCQVKVFLNV